MTNSRSAKHDAIDSVVAFFATQMEDLRLWACGVSAAFEGRQDAPRRHEVDDIVWPMARELLNRGKVPLVGAGFVAAFEALADAPWHMAWWQGEKQERLLTLTMESAGETYSRREWFKVPVETGQGHVTGPYVDFLCTDEYTLTITVPVKAGGRIVGVAGADIFVESIETLLVGKLRQIDPKATLLNRSGRVIASADPQLPAGKLLVRNWMDRTAPVLPVVGNDVGFEQVELVPCGNLPLLFAVPVQD